MGILHELDRNGVTTRIAHMPPAGKVQRCQYTIHSVLPGEPKTHSIKAIGTLVINCLVHRTTTTAVTATHLIAKH